MTRLGIFGLVAIGCFAACTKAPAQESAPERPADPPGVKAPPVTPTDPVTPPVVTPPVTPPATVAKVTVELTAVTLAENCGAAQPHASTMTQPTMKAEVAKGDTKEDAKMKMKRRCDVTSMQMIVASTGGGAPSEVKIKTVELFDGGGKSLGQLQAQAPTHWVQSGIYDAWDEKLAPDTKEQIQYVLSMPNLTKVVDKYTTTYRLEVTVSVAGGDQKVEKKDLHIAAPTTLPPNVKT